MIVKVEILHNINESASFGLNNVFTRIDPGGSIKEFEARSHELVKVFEYQDEIDARDGQADMRVCNRAWMVFNVGHEPEFTPPGPDWDLALLYRDRKPRSLSKGDVLIIDDQPYSVESAGFVARSPDELNIITDRHETERLVRSRYEFKPGEELTTTVPWDQE